MCWCLIQSIVEVFFMPWTSYSAYQAPWTVVTIGLEKSLSRFTTASLVAQLVKNPPAMWETRFDPWVGKIPWRREGLPTPVFWPREFHGLYSPWGWKSWTRLSDFHSPTHGRQCVLYVLVTQSCPALCDSMDYSPPGYSVHGTLRARILQWVAIPFPNGRE